MIEKVNLRATSLEEFWGKDYASDMYLWEGAKHKLTLEDIEAISCKTMPDKFSGFKEIDQAMELCRKKYFELIPLLSKRLNDFHNLELSDDFWKISFGYWLYRHICVVYEKFAYLTDINIDQTSINLLAKESFFIPRDSIEHFELFGHDFGVQQLISEYYHLFASKQFKEISKSFKVINSDAIPKHKNRKSDIRLKAPAGIKNFLRRLINPKVVLLFTYYASKHYKKAFLKSRGKLFPISLPEVSITDRNWLIEKRKALFNVSSNDRFDLYLFNSFIYGMPTVFIEDFKNYYTVYTTEINSFNFSDIISEGWIGRNNVAIYCAIANEAGKQLIFQEHASSCSLVERSFRWLYFSFPNKLITTGWNYNQKNVIPGGFMAKTPQKYTVKEQTQILYVSQAVTPYLIEFSWHPSNSNFLNTLKTTQRLLNLLPDSLIKEFKYRPRNDITLWNTAQSLGLNNKKDFIDSGAFYDSISKSKIVIIDHLSTAITELLLMEVPFLLLINRHTQLTKEAQPVFEKLEQIGVVHFSPETLVTKLVEIYGNVPKWWYQDKIKEAIMGFKSIYLDKPVKTFNILDSLLKKSQ